MIWKEFGLYSNIWKLVFMIKFILLGNLGENFLFKIILLVDVGLEFKVFLGY